MKQPRAHPLAPATKRIYGTRCTLASRRHERTQARAMAWPLGGLRPRADQLDGVRWRESAPGEDCEPAQCRAARASGPATAASGGPAHGANGCATSAGFAWREPHELVVACGNRVISFDGSFRATSEVEVAGLAVESLSGSSASRRLLVRHGRDWAVLEADARTPIATGCPIFEREHSLKLGSSRVAEAESCF